MVISLKTTFTFNASSVFITAQRNLQDEDLREGELCWSDAGADGGL